MKAIRARPLSLTRPSAMRVGNVDRDPLKREMEKWYSEYSKTYDRDGYHTRIADRLVEGLEIHPGDRILDLATGTGLAGFAALEAAGESGSLVAVDISPEMLKVASRLSQERGLENIQFVLADAQKLDLEEGSFDVAICSSALVLFPDEGWTLTYWKQFLRPGGQLAVHCFSENSFVRGKFIQEAAAASGIELIFSEPTGTIEKCQKLMEAAGYTAVHIDEVIGGQYITLDSVLESWDRLIQHPMIQLPTLADAASLHSMKDRYQKLAKEAETKDGIWDEDTIMYVYSQRPNGSN